MEGEEGRFEHKLHELPPGNDGLVTEEVTIVVTFSQEQ